jgi:hypothetical protein
MCLYHTCIVINKSDNFDGWELIWWWNSWQCANASITPLKKCQCNYHTSDNVLMQLSHRRKSVHHAVIKHLKKCWCNYCEIIINRGFYKIKWSVGSWIRSFKHYRQQSMGKLYFVGFYFSCFKWTTKSKNIRIQCWYGDETADNVPMHLLHRWKSANATITPLIMC